MQSARAAHQPPRCGPALAERRAPPNPGDVECEAGEQPGSHEDEPDARWIVGDEHEAGARENRTSHDDEHQPPSEHGFVIPSRPNATRQTGSVSTDRKSVV